VTFEQSSEEALAGFPISACLQGYINDYAILIDRAPQILLLTLGSSRRHRRGKTYRRSPGGRAAIVVHTWDQIYCTTTGATHDSHRPSLCQQIFNITMTEIESEIEPHRVLDDVGRKSMAFICWGAILHSHILAQQQSI
jgi:hypothetical protein